MKTFTRDELIMLSDVVINTIANAGQAKNYVPDSASFDAIDAYVKRLKDLNTKICGMMGE